MYLVYKQINYDNIHTTVNLKQNKIKWSKDRYFTLITGII